jgi:4-methyl-5(b-hydroxyethyl)-thiazole monophosphate biosynthesis
MKVYLILADGFEEIEALTVVDILRRGNVDVTTVSIKEDKTVTGAHNIPVIADTLLSQIKVEKSDMIVLPGGLGGVQNMSASETLLGILKEHNSYDGKLAAICAAPTIPGKLGFFKGRKATCYPGCEDDLLDAVKSSDNVVVDNNYITSRGPATAMDFALELLKIIKGEEVAKTIRGNMLYS